MGRRRNGRLRSAAGRSGIPLRKLGLPATASTARATPHRAPAISTAGVLASLGWLKFSDFNEVADFNCWRSCLTGQKHARIRTLPVRPSAWSSAWSSACPFAWPFAWPPSAWLHGACCPCSSAVEVLQMVRMRQTEIGFLLWKVLSMKGETQHGTTMLCITYRPSWLTLIHQKI